MKGYHHLGLHISNEELLAPGNLRFFNSCGRPPNSRIYVFTFSAVEKMEVTCPNCEISRDINRQFLTHQLELTCPNCKATFCLPSPDESALKDPAKYTYKIEIIHEPNMLDPFFKKKIEATINRIVAEDWILERIVPWTIKNFLTRKDVLYLFFKKSQDDDEDQ